MAQVLFGAGGYERLKPVIESLPVTSPPVLVVDRTTLPLTTETVLTVNGRGKLDEVIWIMSSYYTDQLQLVFEFDGVLEEYCPEIIHRWLRAGPKSRSPIYCHFLDVAHSQFGMTFALQRFFKDSLQIKLKNKDSIPHITSYLAAWYGVFT
jgi:hypothetical protein